MQLESVSEEIKIQIFKNNWLNVRKPILIYLVDLK